jgi:hypothetical protein
VTTLNETLTTIRDGLRRIDSGLAGAIGGIQRQGR